jgi:N-acetylglucosamine-6-sulfatase
MASARTHSSSGAELGASGRANPRRLPRVVAWAAVIALAVVAGSAEGAPPATAAVQDPNIVVIQTDDQAFATLSARTMPNVVQLVGREGTTFTDNIVTTPLCCPSRASLLTGQYAHNHGTRSNHPGYGSLKDPGNVLPVWLRRAGYVTAHVGKFLNGYGDAVPDPYQVAPGWNEWHTWFAAQGKYYDYDLSVNGRRIHFGKRNDDYVTRVLNRKAVNLINRYVPHSRPLYLQVDQFAPHLGHPDRTGRCPNAPVPDQVDKGLFLNQPLPRPASFNEADTSDKPSFMQRRKPLSGSEVNAIQARYRCALASLRAVDRGVGQIYQALQDAGELQNTVIIFTADNGFFYGEHRISAGKLLPYEEALRVPLLIRVPPQLNGGAAPVAQAGQAVGNIDLAPTVLDFAGAAACSSATGCRVMDGRSLRGLIRGDLAGWPQERGVLVEFDNERGQASPASTCAYEGIRVRARTHVKHTSVPNSSGVCQPANQREHYHLTPDPFQLQNLVGTTADQQTQEELASRLADLRACAGIAGRDPLPASGQFCE